MGKKRCKRATDFKEDNNRQEATETQFVLCTDEIQKNIDITRDIELDSLFAATQYIQTALFQDHPMCGNITLETEIDEIEEINLLASDASLSDDSSIEEEPVPEEDTRCIFVPIEARKSSAKKIVTPTSKKTTRIRLGPRLPWIDDASHMEIAQSIEKHKADFDLYIQ